MATTRRMTADQIAHLFAQRLGPTGGWVSAKQAAWLWDVWTREVLQSCPDARISGSRKIAQLQIDGAPWIMVMAPNGAAHLRPEF